LSTANPAEVQFFSIRTLVRLNYRKDPMDTPNAFIGKATQPTSDELTSALGSTGAMWRELLDWLAKEKGVADQEW
jgi:hypothetical protein